MWRVIVSHVGKVTPHWTDAPVLSHSGYVFEEFAEKPGAAFETAARMLREQDPLFMPFHLQIHMEEGNKELEVISEDITAFVEWPFPAFFWKWIDQFSNATRAKLDPESEALIVELLPRWVELGKKIRVILDDVRRAQLRTLIVTLLPIIPDLGLGVADKKELYFDLAKVAWLAAQPDMVLTAERQRSLDAVLTTLDALVKTAHE